MIGFEKQAWMEDASLKIIAKFKLLAGSNVDLLAAQRQLKSIATEAHMRKKLQTRGKDKGTIVFRKSCCKLYVRTRIATHVRMRNAC